MKRKDGRTKNLSFCSESSPYIRVTLDPSRVHSLTTKSPI